MNVEFIIYGKTMDEIWSKSVDWLVKVLVLVGVARLVQMLDDDGFCDA